MQVAWLNDQQPLLVMFLADGAGSVSQGGEGAKLAVNEAMAFMVQKVQDGELGLNDVLRDKYGTDRSSATFCRGGSQRISSSRFCLHVSGIDFVG